MQIAKAQRDQNKELTVGSLQMGWPVTMIDEPPALCPANAVIKYVNDSELKTATRPGEWNR